MTKSLTDITKRLLKLWRSILDLIAPRACEMCGTRLGINERLVCTTCNALLPRTDDASSPYDNHTARRLWGLVPVERCASFVKYHPHTPFATLIYRLKYGGREDIGEEIGRMMAADYMPSGFFDGIDAIVPMPLHKKRRRERGYNQSYEVARGISQLTHIPVREDIVERVRYTQSQTLTKATSRSTNVSGAFALKQGKHPSGMHILLIDDIITTGATLSACATEIAKLKDVKISIMTIGRTED